MQRARPGKTFLFRRYRDKCDVIEVTLFRTEVINRTLDRLYREAISISVQQALSHANCLGKGSGCDFTCIVFRCRPSQHVRFLEKLCSYRTCSVVYYSARHHKLPNLRRNTSANKIIAHRQTVPNKLYNPILASE